LYTLVFKILVVPVSPDDVVVELVPDVSLLVITLDVLSFLVTVVDDPPEIELKKHNTRITETRIIFQFLAADLFTLSKSAILLL
jgi:hypothetical protein